MNEVKNFYSVHIEWMGTYDRPCETIEEAEAVFNEIAQNKNKGAYAEIWQGIYFPKTKTTRFFLVNTTDFSRTRWTF